MASIIKRKGSYFIMVSGGYDTFGGQIRKTMTWTPPQNMSEKQIKKELQEKMVLFEREVKQGRFLDGSITFAEFSDKWLKDYGALQLAPKTLSRYEALFARIIPAIGHIKLNKLQPQHLIALYAQLANEKNNRNVSFIATDKFFKKELSREKVAQMSGLNLRTVSNAFMRKAVSKESAEAICKALKIKLTEAFMPSRPEKLLGNKTIRHHHGLISAVLNQAVYWQVIPDNPATRVKPPKVEKTEAMYLDEKQATALIELLENANIRERTMIKLFLFSGLRRGELCGLEWQDVDFDNNLIKVLRASQYLSGKGIYTKEPKTPSSVRVIKLPKVAMVMLKEFKKWQLEQRLIMGDAWVETGRLFTQITGEPIHPDTVTGWFSDFIKKTELPQISVHSLRHTNITLLIAAGIPIPTVSKRAGHSNTGTTTSIYAHAIKTLDEMAAEVLEDIFKPATPQRLMLSRIL